MTATLPDYLPSIYLDHARYRPMELDAILAAPLEAVQAAGGAMPRHQFHIYRRFLKLTTSFRHNHNVGPRIVLPGAIDMGDTTCEDHHPMRCEVALWHCLDGQRRFPNVLSLRDGRRDRGVRDSSCAGWLIALHINCKDCAWAVDQPAERRVSVYDSLKTPVALTPEVRRPLIRLHDAGHIVASTRPTFRNAHFGGGARPRMARRQT